MQMSRLQMETGQIWELMVIRQRHPNLLPVEVRIRQIHPTRNRDVNIPVRKCGTKKRQPVQQQAIREILTVRPVIKNFPQERVLRKRSQHHNKDTESNCKQGMKDYNHMYTVWDNDQNGKDCKVSKIKLSKTKYTYRQEADTVRDR